MQQVRQSFVSGAGGSQVTLGFAAIGRLRRHRNDGTHQLDLNTGKSSASHVSTGTILRDEHPQRVIARTGPRCSSKKETDGRDSLVPGWFRTSDLPTRIVSPR